MKIRHLLLPAALMTAFIALGCQEGGAEALRAASANRSPVKMNYMVDERGLCYAGFTSRATTTKVDDVLTVANIQCSEAVRAAGAGVVVPMQYFKDELGGCYAAFINRAQKTSNSDVVAVTAVPCDDAAQKAATSSPRH